MPNNALVERIAILDRADLPRALACLRERCIPHDPDLKGASLIWLHDNTDAEPVAKLLRGLGIKAVRQPWK
jgi:hypothetical protein